LVGEERVLLVGVGKRGELLSGVGEVGETMGEQDVKGLLAAAVAEYKVDSVAALSRFAGRLVWQGEVFADAMGTVVDMAVPLRCLPCFHACDVVADTVVDVAAAVCLWKCLGTL
jgi:hypothetical protein